VRLRVDVAYDGAGFSGFARQPDRRTVQGTVEAALSRIVDVPVVTTGAGRTDAGVHATAQVLSVDVPAGARAVDDLGRIRTALDRLCGPEITVWRVRRVPATFDARFSATARRYRYRLCDAVAAPPLWRHDTWHVGEPALDLPAMRAAATRLLGEHDFSSFCRRAGDHHLVRRIDRLSVRRREARLVVVGVDGPAFCHQMVRSVTGCLVAVGQGRRPPEWMGEVLSARTRQAAAGLAPPHGLTLTGVSYR
jgi:tRNA pseudouridine38-40 synthase